MHGHPAMHMRNQQGKIFHGEEGKEVRRTIDRELKVRKIFRLFLIYFIEKIREIK